MTAIVVGVGGGALWSHSHEPVSGRVGMKIQDF